MPYGKNYDTEKMDSCVEKVMKKGYSKARAIAICKSSLSKSEADSIITERIFYTKYLINNRKDGISIDQTKAEYDSFLAKNNFNIPE